MNNIQFKTFLIWFMCSDPWPIDDEDGKPDGETQLHMEDLANEESVKRGYRDWLEAYHDIRKLTA